MFLKQKSKHETRRRKGTPVSKSYEDYEIEWWWDCCGIWFRGILPSLVSTEINGSPVKNRSHIRLNQETLAQWVGWISETPSTKIICDNRMNAGGWRCAYPPYLLMPHLASAHPTELAPEIFFVIGLTAAGWYAVRRRASTIYARRLYVMLRFQSLPQPVAMAGLLRCTILLKNLILKVKYRWIQKA